MANPTINMPDALLETIDRQPGINRSGWVRDAIDMRLYADEAAAEYDYELPDEWWQEAIEMYLDSHEPASIEAKTT